ncbi:MAG: FAD-dependent thymidylate synthase [Anaerolineaceae bacterium]|nr:FAD-dependent thymidylate synthase [Anaerolineaceae bacterium]
MLPERRVYLLEPQKYSPETIAVTFAKTSRSPLSFAEIAEELTNEKSAAFHEKWVVGYGHASVAEHAVLHIALENISRLAVETIEGNRLASYTEKSTRYQKWSAEDFFIPSELDNHPLREIYTHACQTLFQTYLDSLPVVKALIAEENPQQPGENSARYEGRIRSQYVDSCRFLLPAASMANVGVSINARALEHALCKMLSHPLEEVRALGEEVKAVALGEVPTLVKYAACNPRWQSAAEELSAAAQKIETNPETKDWCEMIQYDEKSELRMLAAAQYAVGEQSFRDYMAYAATLTQEERQRLSHTLMGNLTRHDVPPRALEHSSYTVDLVLDQGAYFELKRHRMMTQTPQALTANLGYAIPADIQRAGFLEPYQAAMEAAQEAYATLTAFNPHVASYVVPNAFNRRVLLTFNLRSADHLINLRTAENAHYSIRRAAYRIAEEIQEVTPLLGSYLRVTPGETWESIEKKHFVQTA